MAAPTIVLVHGAFADASGFRGLYDELRGEEATMIAPPNPLRGLTGGDGEYLKAVIGEIDGPVLLVGHLQEVMHLSRDRAEAAHLPHQPLEYRYPPPQIGRPEFTRLLPEIDQDRT